MTGSLSKPCHRTLRTGLVFTSLLLLLIAVALIALSTGSVHIPISDIRLALMGKEIDPTHLSILLNARMPRILLALLVGAALSTSGTMLQAVMQNPLADPGIIGVSAGASLAAIFVLIVFPAWGSQLPVFAFLGGISACALVTFLAWKGGIKPIRLVLAGVAVNALLGGGVSLLTILNSDKIQSVIQWTNGSLAARSWKDVSLIWPYVLGGLALSFATIRAANLMALGDEKAANLGLHVHRARLCLSALAAFLAAVTTCAVGIIGFVGLVIPHISRLLLGSDHRQTLPCAMVLGGIFLLATDTFARTVASPIELPVGTMMSIIGVPFFLYLLRKGGRR